MSGCSPQKILVAAQPLGYAPACVPHHTVRSSGVSSAGGSGTLGCLCQLPPQISAVRGMPYFRPTSGTAFPADIPGLDPLKRAICLLSIGFDSVDWSLLYLLPPNILSAPHNTHIIHASRMCRCRCDAYRYGVYGVVTCGNTTLRTKKYSGFNVTLYLYP
jgi:hypothetical protein